MQKNTVLAIVLAMLVLFGYEAIFVAPKRAQMLKETKTSENKEVTNNSTAPSPTLVKTEEKSTKKQINGEKLTISSTNTAFSISNVGASLHNVDVKGFKRILPMEGVGNVIGLENAVYSVNKVGENELLYTYQDKDRLISKNFRLENNLLKVRMEIKNTSEVSILNRMEINAIGLDLSRMETATDVKREAMLEEYSVKTDKKLYRKNGETKFNPKNNVTEFAKVQWAAFREHYTIIIVKPTFETKAYDIKAVTEKNLNIILTPVDVNIEPGATQAYEFFIYAGPQDIAAISSYGKGMEEAVAFSGFLPIDWIAKGIYYAIPFIQNIIKSWGLSLILVSILIYGITYPLTVKSMLSMRKMQAVQPKIKALQDRYKGDPQKLNAEVMDIYRREKINPLGGCLPFLLQMPFFMAIYQVLWRAHYFHDKGFLWIKDLTAPDRLFVMPFSVPFLGSDFNILPLVMAGVMFVQQKISAKSMVISDETQAMQQKMMLYIFPVFIGFIFYHFASSLSLYFTMFYALSALTQWKMSKVK